MISGAGELEHWVNEWAGQSSLTSKMSMKSICVDFLVSDEERNEDRKTRRRWKSYKISDGGGGSGAEISIKCYPSCTRYSHHIGLQLQYQYLQMIVNELLRDLILF